MRKSVCMVGALAMVALSGCTMMCPTKHKAHKKTQQHPVVFQQTYDNSADVTSTTATVYTRSRHGGDSKMGHIMFKETGDGLKMNTDLVDMRRGVEYTLRVHQCGECGDASCCDKNAMNIDLPKLKNTTGDRYQTSYIVRGLTATQLKNAKIYMERDGGYRAAWGILK